VPEQTGHSNKTSAADNWRRILKHFKLKIMNAKIMAKKKAAKANQPEKQIETGVLIASRSEYKDLPVDQIDYSPFNYRKKYSQKDLEDFAVEIAQHGIISPLTIRRLASDKYELVAGERRLRAAKIAGLSMVPVVVKEYTDEHVREIQLAENLQRENPHPLHEVFAIGQMQQSERSRRENFPFLFFTGVSAFMMQDFNRILN
jgi:hypothetical protein